MDSSPNHRPLLCSRRDALKLSAAAAGMAALPVNALPPTEKISSEDDAFLEELERTTFAFFWENSHPVTGQAKDRSRADGPDKRPVASIASTGFGLTSLCIAHQRGWRDKETIQKRVRTTLEFVRDHLPHEHGFHYHFVNYETGAREWKCELSSIDSTLLFCGVLTCGAYFKDDAAITKAAAQIYERADWKWMANGGATLTHGWKPESGFLKARWSEYCEHMMLYLLAIGSPTHPVEPKMWESWSRPWMTYAGIRYINISAPLFIHQYSHAWFDFHEKRDRHTDYFENSIKATRAHKEFCWSLRGRYPHLNESVWGITASDSANGYRAWGGPPEHGGVDGSIVPCAAAGSLPFLPKETISALNKMRALYGDRIWKRYGFVDAFNPATNWVNPDVIGIDAGITILMAENLRTGFVWRTFMQNEGAQRGMRLAGFQSA